MKGWTRRTGRSWGYPTVQSMLVVTVATGLFLVTGCGTFKHRASEGDSQVAVLVQGSHSSVFEQLLRDALERPIFTPQPENRFYLVPVHFNDSLSHFSRWQNIILVGALDSDDPVSARIQAMLKGKVLDGVRAGEYTIFRKTDIWAKGQTVLFLVADTRAHLADWISRNGTELYTILSNDRDARMLKSLYAMKEEKALSDSLAGVYSWRIRLPHEYLLVREDHERSYVRLRRVLPDRFITIAWRKGGSEALRADSLLAWRDRIGATFTDSIRVHPDPQYIRSVETTIDGKPAIRVYGLWETFGSGGGGPFVSFMMYDNGTLYLLDGQVYAPDRAKEPFIRAMELVLRTFGVSNP